MNFKLKAIAVVLLLVLTLLSLSAAAGGGSVTIKGKGQPWATRYPDGRVEYGCSPTTNNPCDIIIDPNG